MVHLKLDLSRIEGNVNDAQYALDRAVMTSMVPLMPRRKGSFIQETTSHSDAMAGSGVVEAATGPHGRFLYEGKTMVDEKTGSPWAKKYNEKVLVSQFGGKTKAKPNLTYSHRGAKAHWFDAAKEKDHDAWIDVVRKEVGKK